MILYDFLIDFDLMSFFLTKFSLLFNINVPFDFDQVDGQAEQPILSEDRKSVV